MLKKAALLLLAILVSLLIAEFVVSELFGFPKFGVAYKARYRTGGGTWTNVKKPYSCILNVEGKRVTKLNNYGLPGKDIVNLDNPIVLLGSSFVEALQYAPEDIASSRFEDLIRKQDATYDVINLGCSGHDPYDSYFRLKYFEQVLPLQTDNVILIINSDNRSWFTRHPRPLDFNKPSDFAQKNNSKSVNLQLKLRNSSSLIELIIKGLLKQTTPDGNENEADATNKEEPTEPSDVSVLNIEMMECLRQFNRDYKNFIVVSVYDNVNYNVNLQKFCQQEKIWFSWAALTKPENQINAAGHFNLKGNQELAKVLNDAYLSSKQFQLPKGVTNVLQ